MCKALGVATGVKVRTSKGANEHKVLFLVETLKVLAENLESADLQAVKKIVEAKVKVYKAQQKAIEDRKKKEEEDKLKKAAQRKRRRKRRKRRNVCTAFMRTKMIQTYGMDWMKPASSITEP